MSPQALALAAALDESSAVQLVNESAAAYTNTQPQHTPPPPQKNTKVWYDPVDMSDPLSTVVPGRLSTI